MNHIDQTPTEGSTTKKIEEKTSMIPSGFFLAAAGGAMLVSLLLQAKNKGQKSNFFGQWVAPILLTGLYNKIVKTLGHDSQSHPQTNMAAAPGAHSF